MNEIDRQSGKKSCNYPAIPIIFSQCGQNEILSPDEVETSIAGIFCSRVFTLSRITPLQYGHLMKIRISIIKII